MNIGAIIDKVNIKDLPEMISTYLNSCSIKKLNNLRNFYSSLLGFISDDVKNSYLNRILKYLSSETPSIINIIEDFNDGIYDKELTDFSKYITNTINKTDSFQKFYEALNREINFIFYDNNQEYHKVKTAHNEQDYHTFIYLLLKHSFKNYQLNIPGIVSKRLLNEALTLTYNSEGRKRVIQASAELGNELAINLHASHIYLKDKNEATKILLKNKNKESELWQIAYEIEVNSISKETLQLIKSELKNVIVPNDFTDRIIVTEKGKSKRNEMNLLYAYKIYYYTANKFGFTKAYNSLGKLMITDYVSYENNRKKTIEIAKEYFKKAMLMGNINAATNLSIYYYHNRDDEDFNFFDMKKMFEVSAILGDLKANYYYGKILIDEGNYKEGILKLEYATDRNYGLAYYELGKYYELSCQYNLAIDNYKKAILNNVYDAAYNLAILYLSNSLVNEVVAKNIAINYLKTYKDKLSDEIKLKADEILESIK